MKKLFVLLCLPMFIACGGGEKKSSIDKDLTYEQRIEDVCDCYSKNEAKDCEMLVTEHIMAMKESKMGAFLLATENCRTK